ncbi:MAG TPA: MFS transporter, partial [Spirochaetes bacterium]|nr:MFS transporter [Spirochaetota bacterium]
FLSMIFMLVYVFVSIPASWVIDTKGVRLGVGIGAALTGVFGLLKGFYAENYVMISVSQFGLAVAQPFILNAYTRLASRWFPIEERATATGIAALAQYIGIIIAMAATPFMLKSLGMKGMLMSYGVVSVIGAAVFLLFMREKPATPPCAEGEEERYGFLEGLKHMLKLREMRLLLILFFIGIGMFNAVTTWIEQILQPRGFGSEDAGIIGALMMAGGVVGASVLPPLSDKLRNRRGFLIVSMICLVPGLVGLTFASNFTLLLVSSFVLGFFVMSAGPIGFQYGAEITYPAPESTSQGLILLSGQISGIIFIFGMDAFRASGTGSMTPFMVVFIVLTLVNVAICTRLKESKLIREG